jgi:hypothetical protein
MLTPCGISSDSRTNAEDGEPDRQAVAGAGSDGVRADPATPDVRTGATGAGILPC